MHAPLCPISILIPTKNERANIRACLESCRFADEVFFLGCFKLSDLDVFDKYFLAFALCLFDFSLVFKLLFLFKFVKLTFSIQLSKFLLAMFFLLHFSILFLDL